MAKGIVIYENLENIKEELKKKLDEIKFTTAVGTINENIDQIKTKIDKLDEIIPSDLAKKISAISGIDNDTLNSIKKIINEYNNGTNSQDALLEQKVSSILYKSGAVDLLTDKLTKEINSLKKEIIDSIKIPMHLKDVNIKSDLTLDIDYNKFDIIDVLDFSIPIYYYNDDKNLVIKYEVIPVVTNGKVIVELLSSDDLVCMTAIKLITKIK